MKVSLLPTDIAGFDSLAELALDMRWSWNHATDRVWPHIVMTRLEVNFVHFRAKFR
jgi:hypothetical protein